MVSSGSQIGKYLLGKKLGHGGFGVVFRAQDLSLDREVALKFLHPEHTATPQILQRFLQEARSAAKVAHPGIVTVYECGQIAGTQTPADGTAYIAMELLDGESLTDRLARSGRLVPGAAMEITRQIASALEAAHRAGIVHRDLKPDNIFLVQDPAVQSGERVKVLDFGIAKLGRTATSSVQTQSMMVFGTPRYMSPEQCKSATHVDHRSDIYTLGCILFELVTGRPPFAGQPGELIAQHLLVAPPSAISIVPELPMALERLIAEMLAKEPDARPPTMAAVQRALQSGGAFSPGVAATMLPDQIAGLPQLTPPSLGVAPSGSKFAGSANPTTLGSATGASIVRPRLGGNRRAIGYAGGAVVAASIAVALWLGLRGDDDKPTVAATPPLAGSTIATTAPKIEAPRVVEPAVAPPRVEPKVETVVKPVVVKPIERPRVVRPVAAMGTLAISCRPASCSILIDGVAARQSRVKLPTGSHQVALVVAELGIRDSFAVEIKPGATETVSRDYGERVKQPDPKPEVVKDKTINPFAQGSASK